MNLLKNWWGILGAFVYGLSIVNQSGIFEAVFKAFLIAFAAFFGKLFAEWVQRQFKKLFTRKSSSSKQTNQ
ncbi:MAG: hypothetical protein AAGA66_08355 [Bacteroidota bacterium]